MLPIVKPLVYIETSVVSYLTSRPSRDLVTAAHQELTREWWEERSQDFELVISELVEQEATRGDAVASRERMAKSAADALHVAVAAVNGVDYLPTWNHKHIANAAHRQRIEALVEDAGNANGGTPSALCPSAPSRAERKRPPEGAISLAGGRWQRPVHPLSPFNRCELVEPIGRIETTTEFGDPVPEPRGRRLMSA